MKRTTLLVSALATAVFATGALAKVPEAQVNRLGQDLTPMGSEKAGDGDIPAWTGGLQTVPSNVSYKPGDKLADPFASDPVKFTITGENAGQYDDILTPGYKALLKAYPTYKMNVYESRRTCAFQWSACARSLLSIISACCSSASPSISPLYLPISPLYLAYISSISPLYLRYISLYLARLHGARAGEPP